MYPRELGTVAVLLASLHAGHAALSPVAGKAIAFAVMQEGMGVLQGSNFVPEKVMEGYCTMQVSPQYPHVPGGKAKGATVVLRVAISRTGRVTPQHLVSGDPLFEMEAMNAVRLWKFKPYVHEGVAEDVTTELSVEFTPGLPGGIITHPNR